MSLIQLAFLGALIELPFDYALQGFEISLESGEPATLPNAMGVNT